MQISIDYGAGGGGGRHFYVTQSWPGMNRLGAREFMEQDFFGEEI